MCLRNRVLNKEKIGGGAKQAVPEELGTVRQNAKLGDGPPAAPQAPRRSVANPECIHLMDITEFQCQIRSSGPSGSPQRSLAEP